MKRFFTFLVGASFGVAIIYALRRFFVQKPETPAAKPATPPVSPSGTRSPSGNYAASGNDSGIPTANIVIRRPQNRPVPPKVEEASAQNSPNGVSKADADVKAVKQELESSNSSKTGENASTTLSSEEASNKGVDFTVIEDIGIAFNRKLHDFGVHTFEDLIALSVQEIATITGTAALRIEKNRWIEQAKEILAGGGDKSSNNPGSGNKAKE